jgi:DNA repair photolyase
MPLYSGRQERLPYSLSRWTDLPAAKWDWFKSQLDQGKMRAFDPRNAIPVEWSLAPSDTMGLIFWTKNPENLIRDKALLEPYKLVIHMTLTGWEEVEKGAPNLSEGISLMRRAVDAFGPERVTWRFSPVPLVDDVLDRFERMASVISLFGLKDVYVAFLQENDLMPETRARRTRVELLKQMALRASGLQVLLCNEDRSLQDESCKPRNLQSGVCESGWRFAPLGRMNARPVAAEGCGCALAVDPFTINESCTMGCAYCYAADKSLAPKKQNTTKFSLPLIS